MRLKPLFEEAKPGDNAIVHSQKQIFLVLSQSQNV